MAVLGAYEYLTEDLTSTLFENSCVHVTGKCRLDIKINFGGKRKKELATLAFNTKTQEGDF